MSGPRIAAAPDRYDRIGHTYAARRRADPRWHAAIADAIGAASSVLNVGAGTGNYEPADRRVVAVEPSAGMLAQRPGGAAPAIQGVAEALPFGDDAFDVAVAILTVHHWTDPDRGLDELVRVARRQVVVSWDPGVARGFWLYRDYLPELVEFERHLPSVAHAVERLGAAEVRVLPVPRDCTDGFLGAQWARPATLLDADAIASISGLALLDRAVVDRALAALRRDLADGTWAARNAELAGIHAFDAGYRLVVAERP